LPKLWKKTKHLIAKSKTAGIILSAYSYK